MRAPQLMEMIVKHQFGSESKTEIMCKFDLICFITAILMHQNNGIAIRNCQVIGVAEQCQENSNALKSWLLFNFQCVTMYRNKQWWFSGSTAIFFFFHGNNLQRNEQRTTMKVSNHALTQLFFTIIDWVKRMSHRHWNPISEARQSFAVQEKKKKKQNYRLNLNWMDEPFTIVLSQRQKKRKKNCHHKFDNCVDPFER